MQNQITGGSSSYIQYSIFTERGLCSIQLGFGSKVHQKKKPCKMYKTQIPF